MKTKREILNGCGGKKKGNNCSVEYTLPYGTVIPNHVRDNTIVPKASLK